MTVNRVLPTSTTDPSGLDGDSYADQVAEEVEALWRISAEPLTSVSGTDTITAATLVAAGALASYQQGNKFSFEPANTNTGAVTIEIDSLGAKSIKTRAGGALAPGEIVAGSEYLIEYDGTNFRLLSNSRPAVLMTGADEPTSDATAIGETGLSKFRDIEVSFALHQTGAATLHLQARVSGGTWRTLFTIPTGTANILRIGSIRIRNFGLDNAMKLFAGSYYTANSTSLDRSDAIQGGAGTAFNGISTYSERWDEFQIKPNSGSIEGSTADARAYVAYYGLGEGD